MSFLSLCPRDVIYSIFLYLEYPDIKQYSPSKAPKSMIMLSDDFWKLYFRTHYSKTLVRDNYEDCINCVHISDSVYGPSLFISAASMGCEILVKNLIIDITIENKNEAFKWAAYHDHLEVVKLLLDNGANVHYESDYAVLKALKHHHYDMIKLLLSYGANIRTSDSYVLRMGGFYNDLYLVKLGIENGDNIHVDDNKPLRYAITHNNYEMVEYLLKNGANSNDGLAICHNIGNNNLSIINLLKEYINR